MPKGTELAQKNVQYGETPAHFSYKEDNVGTNHHDIGVSALAHNSTFTRLTGLLRRTPLGYSSDATDYSYLSVYLAGILETFLFVISTFLQFVGV